MSEINSRQFFRVIYPKGVRPKATIGRKIFPIIDLSEGGMKIFSDNPTEEFKVRMEIEGVVAFADGSSLTFKGFILRIHKDFIVVRNKVGIPLKKILSEQRFLIKEYGTLLEKL